MKKRILACLLAVCILAVSVPFAVLPATAAATDPVKSIYERDMDTTHIPSADTWYEGQLGDYSQYGFDKSTKYAEYIAAFDAIFGGTGDYLSMVGNDTTYYNGYVTREDLGASATWDGQHNRADLIERKESAGEHVFSYVLDPTKEAGYEGPDNLPKLFLVTGTQGDEKGAIYGTYCFIRDLIENGDDPNNELLYYYRHYVKWVIVPCNTPYGMNNNTYWNANGVNIVRNFGVSSWTYVEFYDAMHADELLKVNPGLYDSQVCQYAGEAPFDQPEARMIRDLLLEHDDTFFFVDYHTYTSGNLPAGDYQHINWVAGPDTVYEYPNRLKDAAYNQFDKVTTHFKQEFPQYIPADVECGIWTVSSKGTAKDYAIENGFLAVTMEGFCGFNQDVFCGPDTKKANSELIANWFFSVLTEYTSEQTDAAYTTVFTPLGANFPTVAGVDRNICGYYEFADAANWTKFKVSDNGVWQVGYKVPQATADSMWDAWGTDFTAYTHATKLDANSFALTSSAMEIWKGKGGMYLTGGNMKYLMANGYANNSSTATEASYPLSNATIRYNAEYSGRVTVDITELTFWALFTSLVVLHNGEEVGRIDATNTSANYDLSASGTWYAGSSPIGDSTSISLDVTKGDSIEFVNYCDPRNTIDNYTQLGITTFDANRTSRGVDNIKIAISYHATTGGVVSESYSGLSADSVTITKPGSFTTFFNGFTDGTAVTIRPEWLTGNNGEDLTFAEALEKFKAYLYTVCSVTPTGNFSVGAMQNGSDPITAGTTFAPLAYYGFLAQSNILYGAGQDSYSKYISNYQWYVTKDYLTKQIDQYCTNISKQLEVDGTKWAKEISYSTTDFADLSKVPFPSDKGSWMPSAHVRYDMNAAYTGVMFATHKVGGIGALAYTVPSGTSGILTLKMDAIYYGEQKNAYEWNISKNGTPLFDSWQSGDPSSATHVADINAALKTLSISVAAGDRIEFCVKRTGSAFYISPAMTVTIDRNAPITDSYSGLSADHFTVTKPTTMVPFFTGYSATGTLTVNARWCTDEYGNRLTVAEALEAFKAYLWSLSAVTPTGAWQVGAMEGETPYAYGTNFKPIAYYGLLSQANILCGTGSSSYKTAISDSHWFISETYFAEQLKIYCAPLTDKLTEDDLATMADAFAPAASNFDTSTYVPHQSTGGYIPTGSVYGSTTAIPVAYQAIMLAPHQSGRGGAFAYTVPAGFRGTAVLSITDFAFAGEDYDNAFSWALSVNGELMTGWQTADPATDGYIATINTVLAALDLSVTGGQRIEFCIKRTSAGNIRLSPAMTVTLKKDAETLPMHQVEVLDANGNNLHTGLYTEGTALGSIVDSVVKTTPVSPQTATPLPATTMPPQPIPLHCLTFVAGR